MSLGTEDEQTIYRAKTRIEKCGVDPLTIESLNLSLDMAKKALTKSAVKDEHIARAIFAQAVSFAHFVSGARTASKEDAENAVRNHVADCVKLRKQPDTKIEAIVKIARIGVWPLCICISVLGSAAIVAMVIKPELAAIAADAAFRYAGP